MGRVTERTESERIRHVLQDWVFWRGVWYPELGLSHVTRFVMEVPRSVFTDEPGKPGDVDILFCDPARPDEAIAVECKSLTVKPEDVASGDVRRLHNLDDAVAQVNGLSAMGFHRVYLVPLVAVDASEQTQYNLANRGPTGEHLRVISEAVEALPLDESVGVICLFVSQLNEQDVTRTGAVGPWHQRKAIPQAQPAELTRRVRACCPNLLDQPTRPFTLYVPVAELLARGASGEPLIQRDDLLRGQL